MELTNAFDVGVAPDEAWEVLTDLERIAPCMPGAQLQEVEGDEYRGTVKVKVGPITAQYKGTAIFVEQDAESRTAVLKAEGRDTRGAGNASALITAALTAADGGTHVEVGTDLKVTGKVAQMGRGVMADVSAKLMGEFVENLESTVLAGDTGAADADTGGKETEGEETEGDGVRAIDAPEPEAIDLLSTAGGAIAKRVVPAVVVLAIVIAVIVLVLV